VELKCLDEDFCGLSSYKKAAGCN